MFPMQGDIGRIAVEYDRNGRRVRKTFDDVFAAKAFYVAKFRLGKNPRVVRADAKDTAR
jgi:hypothetical protein